MRSNERRKHTRIKVTLRHHGYAPSDQPDKEYYLEVLKWLRDAIKGKQPNLWDLHLIQQRWNRTISTASIQFWPGFVWLFIVSQIEKSIAGKKIWGRRRHQTQRNKSYFWYCKSRLQGVFPLEEGCDFRKRVLSMGHRQHWPRIILFSVVAQRWIVSEQILYTENLSTGSTLVYKKISVCLY